MQEALILLDDLIEQCKFTVNFSINHFVEANVSSIQYILRLAHKLKIPFFLSYYTQHIIDSYYTISKPIYWRLFDMQEEQRVQSLLFFFEYIEKTLCSELNRDANQEAMYIRFQIQLSTNQNETHILSSILNLTPQFVIRKSQRQTIYKHIINLASYDLSQTNLKPVITDILINLKDHDLFDQYISKYDQSEIISHDITTFENNLLCKACELHELQTVKHLVEHYHYDFQLRILHAGSAIYKAATIQNQSRRDDDDEQQNTEMQKKSLQLIQYLLPFYKQTNNLKEDDTINVDDEGLIMYDEASNIRIQAMSIFDLDELTTIAFSTGNIAVLEYLEKQGYDLSCSCFSMNAVNSEDVNVVKFYLKVQKNIVSTIQLALFRASKFKSLEIMFLLEDYFRQLHHHHHLESVNVRNEEVRYITTKFIPELYLSSGRFELFDRFKERYASCYQLGESMEDRELIIVQLLKCGYFRIDYMIMLFEYFPELRLLFELRFDNIFNHTMHYHTNMKELRMQKFRDINAICEYFPLIRTYSIPNSYLTYWINTYLKISKPDFNNKHEF